MCVGLYCPMAQCEDNWSEKGEAFFLTCDSISKSYETNNIPSITWIVDQLNY